MVSYGCWLAIAAATARAGTVAVVFTVLQALPPTAESRDSLAGTAQRSPSRTLSSNRAPLSLSRAPSRMGGPIATTKPGPPSHEEARRGSQRLCAGAYLSVMKAPYQVRGDGVDTRAGVTSPQARPKSLKAPGGSFFSLLNTTP